jgi:acetyltransferase-like isoleucine patch superfamily enzyme
MPYLDKKQILNFGFKYIGEDVKISSLAQIYNPENISIGNNSRIDDFAVLSGKINIGNYVHIAPFNVIAGGNKGIVFKDFSGIAYYGCVFTRSDDYSGPYLTNPTVNPSFTNVSEKKVTIEKHALLGTRVTVFPGVVIGEGATVGASSLVNKNLESWFLYAGIPATKLKPRSKKVLEAEERFIKFEN